MPKSKLTTFEDNYNEIEVIVEKKRYQWTLHADPSISFDDVKSIIITHIWKKWSLYDQDKPLGGWVATVVKHQFANILRDRYLSTSSPCSRCPCNMGAGTPTQPGPCSLYGIQGVECDLYRRWYNTKRYSHDVRLPLPLENHLNEVKEKEDRVFNLEAAIESLHPRMKKILTNSEWEIYQRLFVEHKTEEQTASELGFKTSEHGRKMGYKRIRQVKTIILERARHVLQEEGVESFNE